MMGCEGGGAAGVTVLQRVEVRRLKRPVDWGLVASGLVVWLVGLLVLVLMGFCCESEKIGV